MRRGIRDPQATATRSERLIKFLDQILYEVLTAERLLSLPALNPRLWYSQLITDHSRWALTKSCSSLAFRSDTAQKIIPSLVQWIRL